ncbi:MAG: hypothetical protein Kow00106_02880 [Anaerolineae bacterium]
MGASDVEQRIQRALKALRAGHKDEARSILLSVVDEQEDNERAWLYLSAAVETLEEQQICLENVLSINPTNEKARQGLERVNKALRGRRSAEEPAQPQASPSVSPFVTTDFPPPSSSSRQSPFVEDVQVEQGASGAWFAAGPFVEEPPLPPEPDPYVPATSVDWVRDDRPAVYGSGRQVELPSDQDYEEWVRNLNLGSASTASAAPDIELSARVFGAGRAFEDEGGAASNPFVVEEESQSQRVGWGTVRQEAARPSSFEESLRSTISFDEEEDGGADDQDDEPSWPPFWRETPDQVFEPSATETQEAERVRGAESARPLNGAPVVTDPDSYYAFIPDDIEVTAGVTGWRAMGYLLGIAILIALNAVSLGYLLR